MEIVRFSKMTLLLSLSLLMCVVDVRRYDSTRPDRSHNNDQCCESPYEVIFMYLLSHGYIWMQFSYHLRSCFSTLLYIFLPPLHALSHTAHTC